MKKLASVAKYLDILDQNLFKNGSKGPAFCDKAKANSNDADKKKERMYADNLLIYTL